MDKTRSRINLTLGIVVVIGAAAVCLWLTATKPHATRRPIVDRTPRVQVSAAMPVRFEEPIVGYGTVRPKRQVKIVPEVGGRLINVHEDFAPGNVIKKGELLFEIDDRVYAARVVQGEAEVTRLEVEVERLTQERASLQQRLAVAQRQTELAEENLTREQGLLADGATRLIEVSAAEIEYLKQRELMLRYESELALLPHRKAETESLLTTKRSQLTEARLNVEKTRIYCPFDARVDSVTAQESQVVVASFQIATLTDMEALEVSVVIDPRDLRWTDRDAFASAIGDDLDTAPEVRVSWTLHGQSFSWTGRVTRLERVDEVTRSAHLVVEVRDIMLSMDLGAGQNRPPLSVGMFCRAEIPTAPLDNALLVPRHAIHDNAYVYVFEPETPQATTGVLAIRQVPLLRTVGENVLVAFGPSNETSTAHATATCELSPGELVVLSPLAKAVAGMRLNLRPDGRAVAAGDPPATNESLAPILLGSLSGVR